MELQESVYFWPQFIEVCHSTGVAPGDGGGLLHHFHGGAVEGGAVDDILIDLHMRDNGLTGCPVLHIVAARQQQAIRADQIQPVVILPPDGLAPHLRRFQQVQVFG